MSDIKLHLGDCLEIMKSIPDKSIDLVLTDPPYGIGICTKSSKVGGQTLLGVKKLKFSVGGGQACEPTDWGYQEWDKKIPSKEYFETMINKSQNQIIFGGNYFVEYLFNSSCWIVWDKDNSGNFADCELAWTSFKTAVRLYQYRWNGMLQGNMKDKEQRVHPTQKPLPVLKWMIRNYSEQGQTILDPFMGSGTTGVACVELGRNFIGIEIEKKYFDIAKKRIDNAQAQGRLFV